jgi:hypothetical protein
MSVTWTDQFEIKSSSSSRKYTVARKVVHGVPTDTWGCDCPGWKAYRGECKHLANMGLKSCEPRIQPRPKGFGVTDNENFTDAAYKHYNVSTEGFGNPGEWFRLAEEMARGRKRYAPPPRNRSFGSLAEDMKLLGLTEMPAEVKGLVRNMRVKARLLHPDFGGSKEEFTAMFMAYERLLKRYPK